MSWWWCLSKLRTIFLSLSLSLSLSLVMTSIAQLIKTSEYACTGRDPVQASAVFLNELIISPSFLFSFSFCPSLKCVVTTGSPWFQIKGLGHENKIRDVEKIQRKKMALIWGAGPGPPSKISFLERERKISTCLKLY